MGADERIERFRSEVLPIFADCPGHPVATEFLDWLESESPETVEIGDVSKALGRDVPLDIALWTLTILATAREAVLDPEMRYDDGEGHFATLSREAAAAIAEGEAIVDPATGKQSADASIRTYPVFRLRDASPAPSSPSPF